MHKKGKIILISGPSGVGKKTILENIINDSELNLVYSISQTTRKKRENEIHGVDYYFVTENEFEQSIENNEFLEYAEFANNYYGTPKKNVNNLLELGKNVLLEIEVQGAQDIIKQFNKNEIISIFITPPSIEELEARLLKRNTETNDVIKKRIDIAKKELELTHLYSHTIINDEIENASKNIRKIILENAK